MVAQRQRPPGPVLDPNMTANMAMQQTGGTPPGAPPPNAFDIDPMQLEQMIGQGWKVNDDGSMVPPGPGTGVGGPGGYDLDGDGMASGVAGPPGIAGPTLGQASGPNSGLGSVSTPGSPAGPALPSASPRPDPAGATASLGGDLAGGLAGGALGGIGGATAGGLSGLGGRIAGGVSAAAAPRSLTSPGAASPGAPGPALSLGGSGGPTTAKLPGPDLGPLAEPAPKPKLDALGYVAAQNARSLQPAVEANDPNGYAGADVEGSDPRKLLPSRRRGSANGAQQRLTESVGLNKRPVRAQRP